jgi:4-hydroxythreonine-4-phosphate dehydrogenase
MSRTIGITLGDVTGIGPEVALKALAIEAHSDDARYLLIGDERVCLRLNEHLGIGLPLRPVQAMDQGGRFFISNPFPETLPDSLPQGAPAAARAAVAWLEEGARKCLAGELDALVTAPVNKAAIIHTGKPFIGQTELLSQLAGTDQTAMMLLGQDDRSRWLRVVLATTHLPIRKVAEQLTAAKVQLAVRRAAEACRLLNLDEARIGVCGLNPHAGEEGEMGDEEIRVIAPALATLRTEGIHVTGPLPADTLFHSAYHGAFDVVVAMYHDQGLAPLKMVAFENGINWTVGLPFIRTSPDHGTAYDIAGRGVANPSSMRSAIALARQLARGRRYG